MGYHDPTAADLEGLLEEAFEVTTPVVAPEREAFAFEPTTGLEGLGEEAPAAPEDAAVATRPVSGSYRGTTGSFELRLRVDVDRTRPMRMVSGDFFTVSGSTKSYFGSFIVEGPTITKTARKITIRGLGRYTWSAGAPVVQVTIRRRPTTRPAAPAAVQFFTTGGTPGASYNCPFRSTSFRTVSIETDRVSDVTTPVFSSYDTGSLPSGGAARTLSVVGAFAEAGVQMVPTAGGNLIDIGEAGPNKTWSDSELHASMVRHFSLHRDEPQWSVWQVVCQTHDLGPGLYGIMFDQEGLERQGCAVFHNEPGGTTADKLRLQLYLYVHELGHCFNLLHSWQKSFANPPGVDRPGSFSYMNYPWAFPGGEGAFWSGFPFQFDDGEVIHLRHAFRNDIIMGGNPFIVGAGAIDPNVMADPVVDNSGLSLKITASRPSYALGEPVVAEIALSTFDRRGRMVLPNLHPKTSGTSFAISRPDGRTVAYEPLIHHLMAAEPRFLAGDAVIKDSAYIGFGKGGLHFDMPGTYRVRAIYHAPDGSRVMSNVEKVRVRYPTTAKDEQLAELLIGDEQGALFFLLGSESEALAAGNQAFDTVLQKFGDHPVADYVRFAKGINLARTYTIVDKEDGKCRVIREASLGDASKLLGAATAPASPIDDLSKMMSLDRLAKAQRKEGDSEGADATQAKKAAIARSGRG